MRLGTVLRDWRAMNRLTIRQVSKQIGLPISTLSRIENGQSMDGRSVARILTWMLEAKRA